MSLDRGDRNAALAHVDAALAIDPSFLAAVALREQILGSEVALPATLNPIPATVNPLPAYAKFEQRARRRRVDRKVDQARKAIAERRLREAASALNEVIELDPNLPELLPLTASFDDLRRGRRAQTRRGPALAAAAVFGAMMFGATWLHETGVLRSRPSSTLAELVETNEPEPIVLPDASEAEPIATTGSERVEEPDPEPVAVAREPARTPPAAPKPSAPAPAPRGTVPAPQPIDIPAVRSAPTPVNPVAAAPPPSSSVTMAPVGAPPITAAAIVPAVNVPKPATAPPAPAPAENAESQISRALQQYRSAYQDLDATRARDIWPAVDEAALARAFDNLESQTLTFEGCRFDVHGDEAVARCHGSARYVPKIGSREPRTEPRNWTFALRRTGAEWKIQSARAER